ncbi:MAG TPA: hypothetical protein VHU92_02325 [Streptosporangiaceae bacterium]|jgi:hypothetical protein|nr:hypothetical protein [Streptosporangiaceae bacterium]
MSGRHAHASHDRAVPHLVALVVAVVVAAGTGLVIWLVVAGYDLEFWALLWLIWATFTAWSLVRRKLGEWFWIWAGPGQLFLATHNLASGLAARHMWLARDTHVLMLVSRSAEWTAFACSGIAIILGIKSGELLWSRRESRPATDEPD